MMKYDNCSNCFLPLNGQFVCPHCKHDPSTEKRYSGVLPPFVVLNNRYITGRVLGRGGFGITYIAKDMITNNLCAIKEYMPSEYSARSSGSMNVVPFSDSKSNYVFNHGRDKFVTEAKTLLKLINDPIVVDILDYFIQNNTAYLVMEYLDGYDLRRRAKNCGGKLNSGYAKNVFVTVASSLMEIHKKNILHRDLSPENIIVTNNGRVKLIDFGAARNFVSSQNKGMSILLKPGFAPPEQYNAKGVQGPWTDVYALCATFYNVVSGRALVDALFRYRGERQPSLYELGCDVSKKTSDVIERGMELEYKKRYKDFKELMDDIDIDVSGQKQENIQNRGNAQNIGHAGNSGGVRSGNMVQSKNDPCKDISEIKTVQPILADDELEINIVPVKKSVQVYVAAIVGGSMRNRMMLSENSVLKVGRSALNSQYVISGDTNISRIHCILRYDGKNIYITDVSANGTFFENIMRLVKNKEYLIKAGTKFYLSAPNHMLIINN